MWEVEAKTKFVSVGAHHPKTNLTEAIKLAILCLCWQRNATNGMHHAQHRTVTGTDERIIEFRGSWPTLEENMAIFERSFVAIWNNMLRNFSSAIESIDG